VLCVDRDNDLNQKAGVKTPIIGREENLNAAVMFAVKDPEDSDVNSMFAAIEMYDELRKVEPNVEVATIAGSPNVGYHSDRILASQLDTLMEVVKPEEVILVSDGAEDEAVYPIISSRVRISSVRKVVVKQHRSAEGTFYVIKNAIKEKHFLTPVALIILMLSAFAMTSIVLGAMLSGELFTSIVNSLTNVGFAATGILIALYMISYTYEWPRRISKWVEDAAHSMRTGRVRFGFNVIVLIILVIGGILVYTITESTPGQHFIPPRYVSFASVYIWVVMLAAWAWGAGRAVDSYLAHGKFQYSYLVVGMSGLGITAAFYATLQVLLRFVQGGLQNPIEDAVQFAIWVVLAVAIGIAGGVFGRRVRRIERTARGAKESKLQEDGGADEDRSSPAGQT
jgi:putative membrane protein